MKQGVLKQKRVRLLLSEGTSCYRARKKGERKRRSVRGCIVGPDLSILNLTIVKIGDKEIAGVTDEASVRPLRLGPKRASRIRKFLVCVFAESDKISRHSVVLFQCVVDFA